MDLWIRFGGRMIVRNVSGPDPEAIIFILKPVNNPSSILEHIPDRRSEYLPNEKLSSLLARLRSLLEPIQLNLNESFTTPRYPVFVIVGVPRCGTTLLTQVLDSTGQFFVPGNFLSRFAYAPLLGVMF